MKSIQQIHKPLKAFTLIEVLVAMLLSAIVIGMAYLYFGQFQKYLTDTVKSDDSLLETNRFLFVCNLDFDRAEILFSTSVDEIKLVNGDEEIIYRFGLDEIIRETDMGSEQFSIFTQNRNFTLLEKHGDLVTSVDFDILYTNKVLEHFFYYKDYTAGVLTETYLK